MSRCEETGAAGEASDRRANASAEGPATSRSAFPQAAFPDAQSILEAVPAALCLVAGRELRVASANRRFLELSSEGGELFCRGPVLLPELLSESMREPVVGACSEAMRSRARALLRGLHAKGRVLDLEVNPLSGDAGPGPWALVCATDVTGRAQAEARAAESSRSLRVLEERRVRDAAAAQAATEREASARAEAEQRARELDALLTSMAYSVVVAGEDGRIQAVNRATAEFFGVDVRGLSAAEMIERFDIRSGDRRRVSPERLPSVLALRGERVVAGERLHVRAAADERTVIAAASPLRLGGVVCGTVSIYHDITDLDRAEQALRQSEEALREADRHKDEFLAMLSHELRNPLEPLCNGLHLLARATPGGDQAQRAMEVINRQVRHITRLIDDLLDITRISRGKIRLQLDRVELNELLHDAAEDLQSLFAGRGVALEVQAGTEPLWVHGDATRLAQVVGNLMANAAKFTGRGGRAQVSAVAEGGVAVIRVRDNGAGISPEVQPHLFQPFVQADKTLDRSRGGLGLGLALVKGLVEMHGGTVQARSDGLGKGAEFTVRLPLREAPGQSASSHAPKGNRGARRVLVVEDSADAAESLKEVLELNRHEVQIAFSGPEGLAKAHRFRPDVVLCDIGLPGMSGYEVAQALRAAPDLRATYLVALSGYAAPEDAERARAAGFNRHVAKPLDPAALERVLELAPAQPGPGL